METPASKPIHLIVVLSQRLDSCTQAKRREKKHTYHLWGRAWESEKCVYSFRYNYLVIVAGKAALRSVLCCIFRSISVRQVERIRDGLKRLNYRDKTKKDTHTCQTPQKMSTFTFCSNLVVSRAELSPE